MKTGYGSTARFFHWTAVVLVLLAVAIGVTMTAMASGGPQDLLFSLHKSLGVTIFLLMAARLAWRLLHGAPPPSRALSRFEVLASGASHWLLYLVLFAMPIAGYVTEAAGGFPVRFFGLFAIPNLLPESKLVSQRAEAVHLALQWVIYALVLLHAAAALHHHFFRHNDVLVRMWPRRLGQGNLPQPRE